MRTLALGVVWAAAASTVCAAPPSFTDIGDQIGFIAVNEMTELGGFPGAMTGGVCVGDFNNDGYQDVFLTSDATNPDRLFINDGDGAFIEQGAAWGLTDVHRGIGTSAGDYDGDGDTDVFVTSFGPVGDFARPGKHRLYRNDGGTFTEVAEAAGVNQTSPELTSGWGSSFNDYDLDGDLDLFVAGWTNFAEGNRLFRNDGDGTFTDVTKPAFDGQGLNNFEGPGGTPRSVAGFAPRFVDMNGDRYPELLLAADFETSRYFVNNGDGTFTNYTDQNATSEETNGMGNAVGDLNNDGMLDWYVTSIYFDDREGFERNGNKLYRQLDPDVHGNHQFVEESDVHGCQNGGWGWGVVAMDADHDRLLDIVETNGWPTAEFTGEQAYLWMCQPDQSYLESAVPTGLVHDGQGRCLVTIDYDNDGDMDVIIVGTGDPVSIYRNNIEQEPDTNWIKFFFDTSPVDGLAPQGFGTRVEVTAGGMTQVAYMDGGCSFNGTSEKSVHLGLADVGTIDAAKIMWANGDVTSLANISANQARTVVAGGGPADLNGDGLVSASDLGTLVALWNTDNPAADLDGDGVVGSSDLGALIADWD